MPNKNENKKTKQKIAVIVISCIVVLLAIVALVLLLRPGETPSPQPVGPGSDVPGLDTNAGEYVPPTQQTSAKGVAVPGWEALTIPADTQTGIAVDFYNPIENEGLYYLTFELRLPNESGDGYEVLYKSGLVAPGLHVQSIDLSRALPEGNYQAIIHVQPYRMADKSATNNADMKTELIVK